MDPDQHGGLNGQQKLVQVLQGHRNQAFDLLANAEMRIFELTEQNQKLKAELAALKTEPTPPPPEAPPA